MARSSKIERLDRGGEDERLGRQLHER
jgi:hypothetical protein